MEQASRSSRWELAAMIVAVVWCWWALVASLPWKGLWEFDPDVRPILHGLRAAGDGWGWHWWHGVWAQGSITTYWRPVISQIWLAELRIFGEDWDRWRFVSYGVHLALLFALWGFVARFVRSRFVGLVAAFTMVCLPWSLLNLIPWFPLQTSLFSDLGIVLCLWAFVVYLDRGGRRHLAAALLAFVFAVTCREIAFITPGLALCVAWARRKPLAAWPLWAAGAALWGYRVAVLPPSAFDALTGRPSTATLTARALLGPFAYGLAPAMNRSAFDGTETWAMVVGVLLAVTIVLASRSWRKGLAAFAVTAVLSCLLAWRLLGSWEAGVAGVEFIPSVLPYAVVVAAGALVWRSGLRREGIATYGMLALLYLPAAGRSALHQRFELLLAQAIILSVVLAAIREPLARRFPLGASIVSWAVVAALFASAWRSTAAGPAVPAHLFQGIGAAALLAGIYAGLRLTPPPAPASGV